MQGKKASQMKQRFLKNAPKDAAEAKVRRLVNNCEENSEASRVDYVDPVGKCGMSLYLPDGTEHIYMSTFGDIS
jgi:hypothetical protein